LTVRGNCAAIIGIQQLVTTFPGREFPFSLRGEVGFVFAVGDVASDGFVDVVDCVFDFGDEAGFQNTA
jgi:hypothetical protein